MRNDTTPTSDIVASVADGSFDMSASWISVTAERTDIVSYSYPYFDVGVAFVHKPATSRVRIMPFSEFLFRGCKCGDLQGSGVLYGMDTFGRDMGHRSGRNVRNLYGSLMAVTELIGYGMEDSRRPLPANEYFCEGISVPG